MVSKANNRPFQCGWRVPTLRLRPRLKRAILTKSHVPTKRIIVIPGNLKAQIGNLSGFP